MTSRESFVGEGTVPKVGDLVFFPRYGGMEFEKNDVVYRVINDEDIPAILDAA